MGQNAVISGPLSTRGLTMMGTGPQAKTSPPAVSIRAPRFVPPPPTGAFAQYEGPVPPRARPADAGGAATATRNDVPMTTRAMVDERRLETACHLRVPTSPPIHPSTTVW